MVSRVQKYLAILLLFSLSACTPVEQQKPPVPTVASSQSLPTYLPSTSYPAPAQASTTLPSVEPVQQATLFPSVSPPPTGQVSPALQVSQLRMFDADNGWAVLSSPFIRPDTSQIRRTTDGMSTWKTVTPPISENGSTVRSAFFIDINTAVVVSSRSLMPSSSSVEVIPWRTTNGGQTWQIGKTFQMDQAPEFYPDQLTFLNTENGWMLGESDSGMHNLRVLLFETQDGGMHWSMVYDSANHLSDPNTLWVKGYYPFVGHLNFASMTAGYFSDGVLFGSQDEGKSWVLQSLPSPADLPYLGCQGGNCKYVDTISVPQFSSVKDGVLIRRAYLNTEAVLDVFVGYPNTQNRLPMPTAQYFYFTRDGGETWAPQLSPIKLGTMVFRDAKTGWLLGKNDPDPTTATHLYQTTDGGESWVQISANCPLALGSELQFVSDQTGFAFYPYEISDFYKDFDSRVGQASSLFKTNDGGRSWVKIELQGTH